MIRQLNENVKKAREYNDLLDDRAGQPSPGAVPCGEMTVRTLVNDGDTEGLLEIMEFKAAKPGTSLPITNPRAGVFIPVCGRWRVLVKDEEVPQLAMINSEQSFVLHAADPGCIGLVVLLS
jgi:hypothetical protein